MKGFLLFLAIAAIGAFFASQVFGWFTLTLAMFSIFVFGTFWFWALVVAETILLFFFLNDDDKFIGNATLSLIIFLLVLQFFGDVKIFSYALENPLKSLFYLFGYVVVGVLWSFGKWWFYLMEEKRRYDTAKNAFLKDYKIKDDVIIPVALKEKWKQATKEGGYYNNGQIYQFKLNPQAKEYKGKIITWMCYWPWSMVWTLINDPIKKLFKNIYNWLQNSYQRVSDYV